MNIIENMEHESYKRLREVMKNLGINLSDAEIARKLNLLDQHITHWKNRGVPKNALIDLADEWGFRIKYVLEGEGDIFAKSQYAVKENTPNYKSSNNSPEDDEVVLFSRSTTSTLPSLDIPVISWVQAGELCLTEVLDKSQVTEWRGLHLKHSEHTYVLKIIGTSMEPQYLEGTEIFVDPLVQPEHNDDVIVCDPEGKATFKRLKITPDGKYLEAINPDFPNRIIKIPEDSIICGVVIYSGSDPRQRKK